jgi:Family of unknown function (DUF5677)
MLEIFILTKWIQKQRTNAPWAVMGHDLRDLNRFVSYKDRSRLRKKAVAEMQQRFESLTTSLPKKGRYWDKKRAGQLRKEPDLMTMARECGTIKIYRSYYKLGSEHAHSSHKVLARFMP